MATTNDQPKTVTDSDTEDHLVSSKIKFITSSLCASGACVGFARLEDGAVMIRNTTDSTRQPLSFTKEEWQAFIAGVKNDEFNV